MEKGIPLTSKRMKKILVIDDDPISLKLIFSILSINFREHQIIRSRSAIRGIEIAKRELPDTILLDILMPEMDGFEVCSILKNNESTKHIPILMVSVKGEVDYRIKGLNAGADAFISKPYDRAELTAHVNVMLRIKFAEDLLRKRNEKLEILVKMKTAEFDNTEKRYLKVSEYALEYFWEVDENAIFTYVSPVIFKILGFDAKEVIGKRSLLDFVSDDEDTETKELLAAIYTRRGNFKGNEILGLHKNGEMVWLAISGFPIFDNDGNFAGYIGVNHNVTRRRKAEEANKKHLEKINEYQKKLKNLYYELTITEEKERRKIAEYLHDGLGQTISIAAIKLSTIAKNGMLPAEKKVLEDSSNLLHEAINETRKLVYDLSPPILYELGLIAAVKWKLGQVEKQFGIVTVFQPEENLIELTTDIKVLLFRTICELLTNTIKHAGADLIEVEIHKDPENITVTVFDNGKGFDLSQGVNLSDFGGFGLFSIKEKLDSLQGKLMITLVRPQGIKITVIVPV